VDLKAKIVIEVWDYDLGKPDDRIGSVQVRATRNVSPRFEIDVFRTLFTGSREGAELR
jgi:hypothetical protein